LGRLMHDQRRDLEAPLLLFPALGPPACGDVGRRSDARGRVARWERPAGAPRRQPFRTVGGLFCILKVRDGFLEPQIPRPNPPDALGPSVGRVPRGQPFRRVWRRIFLGPTPHSRVQGSHVRSQIPNTSFPQTSGGSGAGCGARPPRSPSSCSRAGGRAPAPWQPPRTAASWCAPRPRSSPSGPRPGLRQSHPLPPGPPLFKQPSPHPPYCSV